MDMAPELICSGVRSSRKDPSGQKAFKENTKRNVSLCLSCVFSHGYAACEWCEFGGEY